VFLEIRDLQTFQSSAGVGTARLQNNPGQAAALQSQIQALASHVETLPSRWPNAWPERSHDQQRGFHDKYVGKDQRDRSHRRRARIVTHRLGSVRCSTPDL